MQASLPALKGFGLPCCKIGSMPQACLSSGARLAPVHRSMRWLGSAAITTRPCPHSLPIHCIAFIVIEQVDCRMSASVLSAVCVPVCSARTLQPQQRSYGAMPAKCTKRVHRRQQLRCAATENGSSTASPVVGTPQQQHVIKVRGAQGRVSERRQSAKPPPPPPPLAAARKPPNLARHRSFPPLRQPFP